VRLGKRGAVNWTIGKLINIVLLTVVMALIIFGLTTGGLNPLIENIGGKFDEVLIMLNIKDDVSNKACFSADVVELGGGEVFLRDVGLEDDKNVVLNVCRNRMCNFTGGLIEYRNKEGVFEKLDGGVWMKENDLFVGSLNDVRFDWELYNSVFDILKDAEGVDFLINPRLTEEFILYGDDSGISTYPMTATWQNNVWVIKHGENPPVFIEGDNVAIDIFANKARSGFDDIVLYNDGSGNKSIGELVGNEGWFGSKDELDDDIEVAKLKVEFAKLKTEYLKERFPSVAEIENLTEVIDEHNEIVVDGKVFNVGVDNIDSELVITFVSEEFRFGMKYMLRGKYEDTFDCGRSSLPFVLVEWDGSWKVRGAEDYYKLNEVCFENVYNESLIDRFLSSKCR
jgi:hypothetical protein